MGFLHRCRARFGVDRNEDDRVKLLGDHRVKLVVLGVWVILPVENRDLQFEDGKNGAVLVFDATDHQLVDTLAPGSNGFIRVVMRGLARERKLGDIGAQPPFRLTRYAGGQITLTDTSTGKQIDLGAFGSSNTEAFARLMNLRRGK